MKRTLISALAATALSTAAWADSVKIGFVTTLTTPAAVIGKDMENAVNLAVEHLGGKAGSRLILFFLGVGPCRTKNRNLAAITIGVKNLVCHAHLPQCPVHGFKIPLCDRATCNPDG